MAGVLALVSAACTSSSAATHTPVVSGVLAFDQSAALQNNTVFTGKIPQADPFFSCGSSSATYAAEIVINGPTNAKVPYEWGDVVPGLQAYAAGTVSELHFGKLGDLPFTHPFLADMTFNMLLDKPYRGLAQVAGTGVAGNRPGALHTEIAEGLIPHADDGSYLPGFTPNEGDRVIAYGPWVVDCGHDDFHTEIHPPSVFAFAHQDGSSTVSNVFSNPYVVTQLFNPDPSKAADLADRSRFTDPNTLPLPSYAVRVLAGFAGIGPEEYQHFNRLESHTLIDSNTLWDGATWYVCAPGQKPDGGSLSVTSSFTTRSGVEVKVTPRDNIGCAQITASVGSKYAAAPLTRKDCVIPWDILNQQAAAALMMPGLNIQKAIDALVPKSILPKVNRDIVVDCYDPLVAPPLAGSGTKVDDGQAFPFYGQVKVAWKS